MENQTVTTFIGLLRAVNVGGTGKLPMSELKSFCEEVGFTKVRTYIASGNVVFASSKSEAAVKAAQAGLGARIVDLCGRDVAFNHAVTDLADAYVGNDSFGLNLAAYCGKPAVVISAYTRPQPWMRLARGVHSEPFSSVETPDCTAATPGSAAACAATELGARLSCANTSVKRFCS